MSFRASELGESFATNQTLAATSDDPDDSGFFAG
jgi:hypothetical protein